MTPRIINPFLMDPGDVYHALGASNVKRILAEGDSWMSIFVPGDGNLLNFIETAQDAVILDLSYPGDTLAEMAADGQFELFRRLTCNPQHGYEFDLVLLCGGGNDVIGKGLERFLVAQSGELESVADCIDEDELKAVLEEIEDDFGKFVAALAGSERNQDTPVMTCTYDYVTPRDAGISLLGVTLKGPWIQPLMISKGITDAGRQKSITDHLLKRYRRLLSRVARRHKDRFFVVDTLGTLEPALPGEKESADWADEIHPSANGWEKIAQKLNPEIDRILDL